MGTVSEPFHISSPSYYFIQFFGFFLFKLDSKSFRVSVLGIFCYLIKFSANCYQIFVPPEINLGFVNSESKVLRIVSITSAITIIFTEFLILIFILFTQKKVFRCFVKIETIQREVSVDDKYATLDLH